MESVKARLARLGLRLLIAVALVLISKAVSHGALPPISDAELEAQSDAIAVVDVLGVVCHSTESWGNRYGAWVRVQKIVKGELIENETFVLDFVKLGPQSGGVEVLMYPGQRLKLYLRNNDGVPEAWHQDGKKIVADVPRAAQVLPQKAGEVMFASQLASPASQGRQQGGRPGARLLRGR